VWRQVTPAKTFKISFGRIQNYVSKTTLNFQYHKKPYSRWIKSFYLDELESCELDLIDSNLLFQLGRRILHWQRSIRQEDHKFLEILRAKKLDLDSTISRIYSHAIANVSSNPIDSKKWVQLLEEIRSGKYENVKLPICCHKLRVEEGVKKPFPPFGGFIRPFLQSAISVLASKLEYNPRLSKSFKLIQEEFVLDLVSRITKISGPTLILELNIARLRDQLAGESSNDRFIYFSEHYLDIQRSFSILDEHVALGRLLSETIINWVEATFEFISRFHNDRQIIRKLLIKSSTKKEGSSEKCVNAFEEIVSVRVDMGDLHNNGRSVVIAEDNFGHKIVYKPQSLKIDKVLNKFIIKLNSFGLRFPLQSVNSVSRDDYGWREYIQSNVVHNEQALHRFYWRQGSWLAIFHLLCGVDMHHENLIANGEYPIPVDIETLFHRSMPDSRYKNKVNITAHRILAESVLRQAILPYTFRLTSRGGVDNSGLGGEIGQVVSGAVRRWTSLARDDMRIEDADFVSQDSENRPVFNGKSINADDYICDILNGFEDTYNILHKNREEVKILLENFSEVETRQLFRATRAYGLLLRESYHPNDLRDGLTREQLLDSLWARKEIVPNEIIVEELHDLRQGDIPIFKTQVNSKALKSSRGNIVSSVFRQTGLENAQEKLQGFSDKDREMQKLLIRLTLSESRERSGRNRWSYSNLEQNECVDDGQCLKAAHSVAELLETRAVVCENTVSWITMEPVLENRGNSVGLRDVQLAGSDLYHGSSGIALFFGYLGKMTGNSHYDQLARKSFNHVQNEISSKDSNITSRSGAYLGMAGYYYLLLHFASLWSDNEILSNGLKGIEERLQPLIHHDKEYDLLGGCAGLAVVLADIFRKTEDVRILELANRCCDHLVKNSVKLYSGIGWPSAAFGRAVPGYAHGASGISSALLNVASITGNQKYVDAAKSAICYERDFVSDEKEVEYLNRRPQWCHGLSSIAIGRLATLPFYDDSSFKSEIDRGVRHILDGDELIDSCLCHGLAGNTEMLMRFGGYLEDDEVIDKSNNMLTNLAQDVQKLKNSDYMPLHGRYAGLLCGLAGMGWTLLRAAFPGKLPSILTLDPPAFS